MTPDQAWAKYYERESKKGNGKRKEKQFHEAFFYIDACLCNNAFKYGDWQFRR